MARWGTWSSREGFCSASVGSFQWVCSEWSLMGSANATRNLTGLTKHSIGAWNCWRASFTLNHPDAEPHIFGTPEAVVLMWQSACAAFSLLSLATWNSCGACLEYSWNEGPWWFFPSFRSFWLPSLLPLGFCCHLLMRRDVNGIW